MEEQPTLFDFSRPGFVCGCDEAGRGPLAGPVCAAACILPQDFDTSVLDDSKKLSEKRRFELEPFIRENAVDWSIVFIDQEEIDSINILAATMKAMAMCYEEIATRHPISTFYVDGNRTPAIPSDRDANVVAVVKGDSKIPEIMAASILAKTARDRFMIEMDALYPQYGFAVHKGYGTRAHIQALEEFGPCPLHRRTFLRRILSREEPV